MTVNVYKLIFFISLFIAKNGDAQINENAIGGWYMYAFNTTFKESPWGLQGDLNCRNWNMGGDLEQLLLRGGVTYKPKNVDIKLTVGYANVTNGAYGSDKSTFFENRIYQEVLFPVKFGNRFYTNHRFRNEQRFLEGQDFRTRYRYNVSVNVTLNKSEMDKNTIYLAFYNELFINGQRNIGNGNTVEMFDRNRLYIGMGYILKKGLNVQMGIMNQTTDKWGKNQVQLSIHHKF